MLKIDSLFGGVDNSISKTEKGFYNWNDEKSLPFKQLVEEYKKEVYILKNMAQDINTSLSNLNTLKQDISNFIKNSNSKREEKNNVKY